MTSKRDDRGIVDGRECNRCGHCATMHVEIAESKAASLNPYLPKATRGCVVCRGLGHGSCVDLEGVELQQLFAT